MRVVVATKGTDIRVALLDCGHERWLPFDWDGESLECRGCKEASR